MALQQQPHKIYHLMEVLAHNLMVKNYNPSNNFARAQLV